MPQIKVNGAKLYYEVRGGGPPVLLIMGFTGDEIGRASCRERVLNLV